MHAVNMDVYELGAKPSETTRLATAIIGKHETPWDAEQMIEQIHRGEFLEQDRIERLKRCFAEFYGKTRILAFIYTKQAAN